MTSFITKRYNTADPFKIAEKLNVKLEWVSMDRSLLGKTQYFMNQPIILLNTTIRDSNKRYFVLSHELGHVLLHEGLTGYYTVAYHGESKAEAEADNFARSLLIWTYLDDFGELPDTTDQLTKAYGFEPEH